MKTLAAQALAYQYKLQIETAQAVINNTNAGLDFIDKSLDDVIKATEKLKLLNAMVKENTTVDSLEEKPEKKKAS
jgi:hypothetical protein|tara:strand:+ start:200 stop:424 length:225 start_codon:yes stop_codon:yes gene_type:complete